MCEEMVAGLLTAVPTGEFGHLKAIELFELLSSGRRTAEMLSPRTRRAVILLERSGAFIPAAQSLEEDWDSISKLAGDDTVDDMAPEAHAELERYQLEAEITRSK